jgi:hypothetical protein
MKLYQSGIGAAVEEDVTAKAAAARRNQARKGGAQVSKYDTIKIDRFVIKATDPESPVAPMFCETKAEVREILVLWKRQGIQATVVDRRVLSH